MSALHTLSYNSTLHAADELGTFAQQYQRVFSPSSTDTQGTSMSLSVWVRPQAPSPDFVVDLYKFNLRPNMGECRVAKSCEACSKMTEITAAVCFATTVVKNVSRGWLF